MRDYIKYNYKKIIIPISFMVAGLILGFLFFNKNILCRIEGLDYINTELSCGHELFIGKQSYASLRNDLNKFIAQEKEKGVVSDVSIYFRDLQNGPTLGIDEHDLFAPASLLKVPLLLTYENLEDDMGKDILNESIVANTKFYIPAQNIIPKNPIKIGDIYTISDLLEHMIKYSDNTAYYVLLDYLGQISPDRDLLKDTYVDLGILDPQDFIDNTISTKSYASIFVQLYNSSYFNRKEISDKVLAMMSDTDWAFGINAGLPQGLKVSHKFGERLSVKDNLNQLHDCGIVYYPHNPYLLCVMTRGKDSSKLPGVISAVSRMFYQEFDSRKL